MFALPNSVSHVSSAAFAQARLRPGYLRIGSAQVCSPLLHDVAQLRLTSLEIINFNEARDPKHVTTYTILIDMGDYYLRRWLRPLVLIVTCLSSDLPPDLPALQGPG